jgi:uncharacterized membrane protein YhaH (DUF805 family)
MSFLDAVKTAFQKYATFTGRARRSEYWYWTLFVVLASLCMSILDLAIFGTPDGGPLYAVFTLATLLPAIAVGVRRLHDVDRSGWWLLIVLVPLIGWLVLLFWFVTKGTTGSNRFGEDPISGALAPA